MSISFAGNYPAYYDQYVRDYEAGKYSPTSQFAKDKYAHGLDVTRKNRARSSTKPRSIVCKLF